MSGQPDSAATNTPDTYNLKFWAIALVVGIGAGLTGGLLMKLLRLVQHAAWSYSAGDFLSAVRLTSALHRIMILVLAGVLIGIALWIFRRSRGKPESGLSSGIWFRQGEVPLFDMLYNGILSITIVGLGAALGGEAAPKEISAAIASKLSDFTKSAGRQGR